MRLLEKARERIRDFTTSVKRPGRALTPSITRPKIPSLAQLQHIDLFLETWEKNLIGALGFVALLSFVGIFVSIHLLNTVAAPTEGGTLQEVLVGAPRHINPLFAVTDTDRTLSNIFFLPLCDVYNRGIPTLARTCDFSNPKSVTITLDDRVWHDGTPITSDDVIFTITAMQNKAVGSPWRALAARVVASKDPSGRVIITTKQPTPELKTLTSLGIIPHNLWTAVDPARMIMSDLNLKPVGSGPFRFGSITFDRDGGIDSFNLDVFKNFKPQRAFIDELNFRIAPDNSSAYDMFRTRQVDALFVHDTVQTDELVKRDVQQFTVTPPIIISLFFNPTHNANLKKRDVRTAFALALNRSDLISQDLKGIGVATRAPFPSSMLSSPNSTEPDLNVVQATDLFKKNLSANNAATSSTFTLGIPALPAFGAVAENIKKQLAPFGVTIVPQIIGSGTKTGALLSYDLLLLGQDYGLNANPIPFWSTTASAESGANYARYQIKEVDGWLEQLSVENRPDARTALLQKINQRLVADVPAVFLFQPIYQYYIANKLSGVTISNSGDPNDRFATVVSWFLNTKRVQK